MDPNIIEGYDNTIQKVIPFLSEQLKFDPSLSVAKQFWPTGPRIIMNQDSSVAQRWATGWTIGVRVSARAGNFPLNHRVRKSSGAYPATYLTGTRGSFLRIKRPGREADHSPPFSAEVKDRMELYLHSPNTPSWRGANLKEQGQIC